MAVAQTVVSDEASVPDAPVAATLPARHGSVDEEDPTEMVGVRLDHFRIERPLGQGGMGMVYAARDESLDRPVAVKMLRGVLSKPDQQARLLSEARAQARLTHPNVVHIYYIGRRPADAAGSPGPLFFAMEFIDGDSLEDRVRDRGPLGPEEARTHMLQVARGLRAARRAGIVHRDIKPSNLIVDVEGTVKIADFGLATPVSGDSSTATDGGLVGTPQYMAPEQGQGASTDHRADMYSLGASFYYALTGSPPFDGSTVLELVNRHATDPVVPVTQLNPGVPDPLARIVERLMAKDPAARYASYDELIDDLRAAAPQGTTYAGFWIRGAAATIDGVLGGALIALVGWPGLVLHFLHLSLGHALKGQTLAKFLLHIRVQRVDEARLSIGRSTARTLVALWMPIVAGVLIALSEGLPELRDVIEGLQPNQVNQVKSIVVAIAVSNALLSLLYVAGLALAAFHPHKRALHDLVAGSVVTYRLAPAASTAPAEVRSPAAEVKRFLVRGGSSEETQSTGGGE